MVGHWAVETASLKVGTMVALMVVRKVDEMVR